MKNYISIILVSAVLFISCKKEQEIKNNPNPTNLVPFTEVGNQMNANSQTKNLEQVPEQNSASSINSAPGMNPAHGQAGHRCEIAVGAPLNTAPVPEKQQKMVAPTTTVVATTTAVENAPTPQGMNPPHGQANHRCDIEVGAPL